MILSPVFLGSLARRRAATGFSFAAIVLGVALGLAVQAVHEAALAEFSHALRTLAGNADLQISGPRSGFDEGLYALLAARPEVAAASPVVEVDLRPADLKSPLPLLGVDVLALAKLAPTLLPHPAPGEDRLAPLADDTIFLSPAARTALGVAPGDRLHLPAAGGEISLRVAGDLPGAAPGQILAVMDIAAVQARFGRLGRLTRIDLTLASGVSPAAAQADLQALLPSGVVVEAPAAAQSEAANLSRAYRVNLTLLATMALLVGAFLVFSAQALAVVRRRGEFAFLRALGLPRRRLFAWLLAEGAAVGLAGGIVGAALGQALAAGALALFGGDLGAGYFAALAPQPRFDPFLAAAYVALGVLAGVAGAWLPAREAARVAPAQALRAGDEAALPAGRGSPGLGLALLAASLGASVIPPVDGLPLGGYLAIACLLAGSVLLLPAAAAALARWVPTRGSLPARLAASRLQAAPGHAVVAAAGVLTSVALAAAMAIMVSSFRDSVDQWLAQLLPADLYVRTLGGARGPATLDVAEQTRIANLPGIAAVRFTRHDSLRLAGGKAPVALIARPVAADGHELPLVATAAPGSDGTPIWISEAVVDLYGWQPGQRVTLPLAGRPVAARVAGVWRDYARQTGAIMIDLGAYRQLTGDLLASDAALTLAPGSDSAAVVAALASPAGTLEIARSGELRARSLAVFDRTFAVTYGLEAIAVAIGLAGVAASFAALAAARRREFGMLRHLGVSRRQIGWMLAYEGTLAAGTGVLAGLAAGLAIGLVLIEVVNRQSFHWSMDLHPPWASLAVFALALVGLAAAAAVLAGRLAMAPAAILAVREDW